MAEQRHVAPWAGTGSVLPRATRRPVGRMRRARRVLAPEKDPTWYKDAIIYEVHVRAFLDSNGDGVGDFRGLTQKLDYLRDLGVTAIWLLPFYPSPLRDDGYDIADYYSIHPLYGTLRDFREFLDQAHERKLRVITELVVNHTSDQHPWFQRSRQAPQGSRWRDYYVWSDSAEKYREARIIFRDFELSNWTWDPVARAYYWHRFYAHQPDLNFDNPHVHKEITRVLDFWLELGVDGLRLDAIPYLYEREGTSCENLPETHQYLKELRQHVDEKYGDRMLLAEANQWPEEAVTYFGSGKGDECHMAFHFPLMPRIFMAVRMEDRVPIVDILEQTPAIPETGQWALFLRNHDELTLEMVTDEERDYMYRVYANDQKARINLGIRRRLAPLLGNDRRRIELLHLLLFSLPGTPVLYYGDEIGMGDNVFLGDRNSVRTPMQWNSDKNAGFSRASPHALYFPIILDPEYHYEAVNVEAQRANSNSLFWWMKRTLTLRRRFKAFGQGSLEFIPCDNRKVLAFVRQWQEQSILVVANLSRFAQPLKLEMGGYPGRVPVELFGRTEFPVITEQPYRMTLSPHAAFWLELKPAQAAPAMAPSGWRSEPLVVQDHWEELLQGTGRLALEARIGAFLQQRRWFSGKGRQLKSTQVRDALRIPLQPAAAQLLLVLVEYTEGDPEEYLLPVALAAGEERAQLEERSPDQVLARVQLTTTDTEGLLYSAERNKEFCRALLHLMSRRRTYEGAEGLLRGQSTSILRNHDSVETGALEPVVGKSEQSNTSVIYGDQWFLKLFRRLEPGENPDLEVGRYLTEKGFANIPAVAGWLEYRRRNGEQMTAGILLQLIPNAQDAWAYTLDLLSRYFERVRTAPGDTPQPTAGKGTLPDLAHSEMPEAVVGWIGTYIELARLLGQRTAEMHQALMGKEPEFSPEPFTPFYQRSLFQSMRNFAVQNLQLLRRNLERIPEAYRPEAARVLELEGDILKRLRHVYETRIQALRIRCHGDFHLGQVLFTGKDFIIIDFEGEPARALGERRLKRTPLRDVAGMLRSFDYVTHAALSKQVQLGNLQRKDLPLLEPWTIFWHRWVGAVYLKAYMSRLQDSPLLPPTREEFEVLLDAHLLDKVVYELGYEINNRPEWVHIPLSGILRLFPDKPL